MHYGNKIVRPIHPTHSLLWYGGWFPDSGVYTVPNEFVRLMTFYLSTC